MQIMETKLAANAEAKNMLAGENDNNKQRIVTQANGAKNLPESANTTRVNRPRLSDHNLIISNANLSGPVCANTLC
jgi:hypothetical protein